MFVKFTVCNREQLRNMVVVSTHAGRESVIAVKPPQPENMLLAELIEFVFEIAGIEESALHALNIDAAAVQAVRLIVAVIVRSVEHPLNIDAVVVIDDHDPERIASWRVVDPLNMLDAFVTGVMMHSTDLMYGSRN